MVNSTTGTETINDLPQQLKEEYIQAWVAQGTARAAYFRGAGSTRDLTRSQVRLMRAMLDVALDCADADHYLACKTTLERQAYGQLRVEESYSFGSWLSAPPAIAGHLSPQVA
jgi:hypothetical protein